jgi:hypothetical protein
MAEIKNREKLKLANLIIPRLATVLDGLDCVASSRAYELFDEIYDWINANEVEVKYETVDGMD